MRDIKNLIQAVNMYQTKSNKERMGIYCPVLGKETQKFTENNWPNSAANCEVVAKKCNLPMIHAEKLKSETTH